MRWLALAGDYYGARRFLDGGHALYARAGNSNFGWSEFRRGGFVSFATRSTRVDCLWARVWRIAGDWRTFKAAAEIYRRRSGRFGARWQGDFSALNAVCGDV